MLKEQIGKQEKMSDEDWKKLEANYMSIIYHCIVDNIINNYW